MSNCIGNSGRENPPFNNMKHLAEPGSRRGGHLLRLGGDEGRNTGQRHAVEENQRLILTNDEMQSRAAA